MISYKNLRPDWDTGLSVPYLPIKRLTKLNIKALVLDVDGTIHTGRRLVLKSKVRNWLIDAKKYFAIHLLSNNPSKKRISSIAEQVKIDYTYSAAKPSKKKLKDVIEELEMSPSQIAMIGDRIFTDILAGNRLGLYTVLVYPLDRHGETDRNSLVQRAERKLSKILLT